MNSDGLLPHDHCERTETLKVKHIVTKNQSISSAAKVLANISEFHWSKNAINSTYRPDFWQIISQVLKNHVLLLDTSNHLHETTRLDWSANCRENYRELLSFKFKTQWAVCTCHHFLWHSSAECRWRGRKPFSKQTSKPSLCWCFVVLVVAHIHPADKPATVFHRASKTQPAERNTKWSTQIF